MKRMLDPAIKGQVEMRRRASGSSGEIITHEQLNKLKKRARSHKWVPGTLTMTHEDHLDVIKQLQAEEAQSRRGFYVI
ncbi:hypothetical protein AM501_09530 [Aneurinibacillus migulanus]|uniref:hypothetical protein n=1 Tax=Aneurinibacillus migulanus TaxID=47500 RepID=UPI0005B7D8B0|nr:hypothetical protein [Aneurinibacillus migulanus]KIV58957.1 hypothetical protein TS64_04130 [Aneurinibacillus migulanus]KPD08521.1 hypothetical protein AM501_09530 [Aneurinibacillus migulanus]